MTAFPIQLEIIGLPAPQGSKVRFPNGALVDGTSKTGRANLAEWRRAVADAARAWLVEHPRPAITEPVEIEMSFRFPSTKSDPHRHWHATKPDIDKVVRSTLDALKHGGMLGDDALVCSLVASKRYAGDDPIGARVVIWSQAADEASKRAESKERAGRARRRPVDDGQQALIGADA